MRKAIIVCTVAVLALLALEVRTCYGAESLLDNFIEYFSKQGTILDLRILGDGSYDIIMLQGDKIVMYKIKNKENYIQTPLKQFDIEAMKKLTGGAGKAQGIYAKSKIGKQSKGIIIAVTIRPKDAGGYEFLVHMSFPKPDIYRKSFVVDATTWQMSETPITLEKGPRDEFWSKEEQQVSSNELEAVKSISTAGPDLTESASGNTKGGETARARRGGEAQAEGEGGGAAAQAEEGGEGQEGAAAEGQGGAGQGQRRRQGGRGGRNRPDREQQE